MTLVSLCELLSDSAMTIIKTSSTSCLIRENSSRSFCSVIFQIFSNFVFQIISILMQFSITVLLYMELRDFCSLLTLTWTISYSLRHCNDFENFEEKILFENRSTYLNMFFKFLILSLEMHNMHFVVEPNIFWQIILNSCHSYDFR